MFVFLFVIFNLKINDGLNGDIFVIFLLNKWSENIEIVYLLVKWKRLVLLRYKFLLGEGLWIDMNVICKDDEVDYKYLLYVD